MEASIESRLDWMCSRNRVRAHLKVAAAKTERQSGPASNRRARIGVPGGCDSVIFFQVLAEAGDPEGGIVGLDMQEDLGG